MGHFNGKRRNKISARVIALLTAVIIIAMSIFVFKITSVFLGMAKENYDQMSELVSTYFSNQVNVFLDKVESIQDDFTYRLENEENHYSEIEKTLKYYQGFIDEIIIMDGENDDKVSVYSVDELGNLNSSVLDYSSSATKRILDDSNFKDNYIYSDSRNISMIRKDYDENNNLRRIIGFKINTKNFEEVLKGKDYYSNAEIGFVNDRGLIIAHTDGMLIGKNLYELIDDETLVRQIGESLSTNSKFVKKSKNWIDSEILEDAYHDYLFIPIKIERFNTNWGVMFDIPSGSFTTMAFTIAIALSLGGIVTILVLIFFTKLIINHELKPISKIVSVIGKATEGNLSVRANIKSQNEIGKIGKDLNLLLQTMEEDRDSLIEQKNEISDLLDEVEYLMQQNDSIYFETIKSLANTIDAKDSYTGGHCERVNKYAILIAKEYGLASEVISNISYAALLHDIGKIGVSEKIITKDGRLSDFEFEEMKKHPKLGYEIIKNVNFLKAAGDAILHHHERVDGTGYPDGLKDKEISIEAKVISLSDSFDAMTSDRSYRKALKKEEVINQLISNKGYQFDAELVDVLLKLIENGKIEIN